MSISRNYMNNNNIRNSVFSQMSHTTYNPLLRLVSKKFRNTYNKNKMYPRSKVHNLSKGFMVWLEKFMEYNIHNHTPYLKHYLRIIPNNIRAPKNKTTEEQNKQEYTDHLRIYGIAEIFLTLWYEKETQRQKQNNLVDKLVQLFLHVKINDVSNRIRIGDFVFINYSFPNRYEEYKYAYQVSEDNSKKIITSKPLPSSLRKLIEKKPDFYKNVINNSIHKENSIPPYLLENFRIGVYYLDTTMEGITHKNLMNVLQYYYKEKNLKDPNKLNMKTPLNRQPNINENEPYKRYFNGSDRREYIRLYKQSKKPYNN